MRVALAVSLLLLIGCGDSPEHAACLKACDAQNMCSGAKQQPCNSLCNARPKDCDADYTAYWTCAASKPSMACFAANGCGDEFSKFSICITAWCYTHPLDTACFY